MHVLPQLRKLEKKYADTLTVIGVHSPKFDAERSTESLIAAVRRYNVEHPVVNDVSHTIMSSFAVRAWPSLMFIDPEGRVIGKHEGEFEFAAVDRILGQMIEEFDASGVLTRGVLTFEDEAVSARSGSLSFPGKVLAKDDRLFVADSNHHRVIVSSLDCSVLDVIGDGESPLALESFDIPEGILNPVGYESGFDGTIFDNPQGMVLDGEVLYVADAGSNTIVKADLADRQASVVAGTGEQALFRHSGGAPTALPLNSPYALAFQDDALYISMAGYHQLWSMDLAAWKLEPFAGTGGENIVDGPRMEALLAQPYGMSLQGNNLFFADSETSAIRVAKLGSGGRVVTLTGTGLFDFGDRDGIGKDAQLQHPQDVATAPEGVYIADTYNHKIKLMELNTLRVKTIAGSGMEGSQDGDALDARFNEPAGISYLDGSLYVADTNNHLIRRLDVNRSVVETIELKGL